MLLDKASIPFEKIYVEDNEDLAKALGLKQAPTLVDIKDGKAELYVNVVAIKNYISGNAQKIG